MTDLTDKQQMFIAEYLQSFNATEAAIKAGYSESTAYSIGWENLRKPEIAVEIKKRLDNVGMTAEEVLSRIAEQARGAYSSYITENGSVDIAKLVKDGKAHLIKSITDTRYGRKYEFYDAQSALTLMAKHHNLAAESLNIQGEIKHKHEIEPEQAETIFDILQSIAGIGQTTAGISNAETD